MFTKERDGGNMSKAVKIININAEKIYVYEDKIKHVDVLDSEKQLDTEGKIDEESKILDKYDLDNVNYEFDMKIARALTKDEEQLRSYLETCRRAQYSKGKVKVPDNIPEIEYDLTELKDAFSDIENEDVRKYKQIEMYKQAKRTQDTLKGNVKIKMSVLDKAYFTLQEFLQSRDKKQLAIGEGQRQAHTEQKQANRRNKWSAPEYTEKTNKVSREFALQQSERGDKQINEQEHEEMEQ